MLQAIGVIIGMYALVRYVQFMSSKDEGYLVKVCSGFALAFTALLLFGLIASGANMQGLR